MTSSSSSNQIYEQMYELWVLLRRGSHVILRARNNELRQYGISSAEAAVLQVVHLMGDAATVTDLSRHLIRERHSLSDLLRRMQKKGLLRKITDLRKKNVQRLVLTEKGREAYSKSMKLEVKC